MATATVSSDAVVLARLFRVLGDPVRLSLLRLLQERPRTVSELVVSVGQAQPRVSTHLACLRHCGLVSSERRGREVTYRMALEGLDEVLEEATRVIDPLAERLLSCGRIGPDWV